MELPKDPRRVKKLQAYCDEQGVFNIYLYDAAGAVVCSYDPKNYGEISTGGKYTLELHEELIGMWGIVPRKGGQNFSSLGFVVLSRTKF